MNSLLEQLDRCPPFMCYYLCHSPRGWPIHPDPRRISKLTAETGHPLSARTVERMARAITWAGIGPDKLDSFCHATRTQFVVVTHRRGEMLVGRGRRGIATSVQIRLLLPRRKALYYMAQKRFQRVLRHLSTPQRKQFDLLCSRWLALKQQSTRPTAMP
jgi:hypothetical protein